MAKVLSNDLLRVKPKNGSQELKIVLPLGVSVNKLYTTFRGRKQISNEGKKYIRTVVPVIMQNIKNQNWVKDVKGVWHVVEITYYFPDRKKRDSHNYIKLLILDFSYQGIHTVRVLYKIGHFQIPILQAHPLKVLYNYANLFSFYLESSM